MSRHRALIERLAVAWDRHPRIVHGEAAKHATFRRARAALAASGTVTLELALSGVPMVVAYKVSRVEEVIARRLIQVPTIVLPNLIPFAATIPPSVSRPFAIAGSGSAAAARPPRIVRRPIVIRCLP